MNSAEQCVAECCRLWAPPPKQTLSEWAEEHFRLSPEYSAASGRFSPYHWQRGILDGFSDARVKELVVMSATQMIKTILIQCAVAYAIARDPGPILLAQPTQTDAETFSRERISPMIRDMPELRERVAPEKRTSKANTILHKVFDGGSLSLIGAQTPGAFARRSIRYFFCDERDKWPKVVGKEGDGFSLGVKRTATFRSRAKIIQVCSPTVEGNSEIAAAYEISDQRKYWVPCPKCGESQILRWGQVAWDAGDPTTARYRCEHCEQLWTEHERLEACERGEWRAGQPFTGRAGFWISELYSPWRRLPGLVAEFLAKKDDPEQLRTFINTSLAETWKEKGEAPDHERLMARREGYRLGEVPVEVLLLTSGVDVQQTWLQGHVWGWGRDRQRWLIDRWLIDGDPYTEAPWAELTERLNALYEHPGGAQLGICRMAVDSGFAAQEVYRWARREGSGRVMVVKGVDKGAALVSTPSWVDVSVRGRKIKNAAKLYLVNVSMAKSELYGLLGKERPADGEPFPPGWIHFPEDVEDEFFRQITGEHLVPRIVKGYRKHEWIRVRANHDLDCANYGRAAAANYGIDRFSEERWDEIAVTIGQTSGVSAAARPVPRRQQRPGETAPEPGTAVERPGFQPHGRERYWGDTKDWFR